MERKRGLSLHRSNNMRTLTQINVPFHSADLVIIEFNNQPFTAMRPIVEGMGLTWQSQYEKLKQRFSSVITEIVTTGKMVNSTIWFVYLFVSFLDG